MVVDHRARFLYIAVPKTGSISIHFSLGGGDVPEPDLYHQGVHSVLAAHPEAKDYFKFGFVRNPWARLVSLYHDFTIKRIYQYSGKVRHEKKLFHEFRDFEDLCLRIHESPWQNDIFFRAQTELLGVTEQDCVMDFIGRFERLQSDFKRACNRLGKFDVQLQSRNTGEYDNSDYRKHYTPAARDAVAQFYRRDIELLQYGF